MVDQDISRKLAVIVHADVVDSTGLVQRDETLAHKRITEAFQRFSSVIQDYGGTVHEVRGDALVAEFARASDAVSASLSFQHDHTEHLLTVSDEIKPTVRIGVSLGEVVFADNTVTGPGVVLAQRVEQLAQPGGVCLQGAVYEAVPRRLPFDYENLGEQEVKGFDEPVRVYSIRLKEGESIPVPERAKAPFGWWKPAVAAGIIIAVIVVAWYRPWETREEPASVEQMVFPLPDKPSIAVLPFEMLGDESTQDYFGDGLTNDLITALSKFSNLFVIASHSSFAYKDQPAKTQTVSEELGVRYVLKGSVQKSTESIRINAQLIDALSGRHLWAERFDRQSNDLLVIQDEIVASVVSNLAIQVDAAERERVKAKHTGNLEAYDYYLRANDIRFDWDRATNHEARQLLEKAIELDPDYARAHSALAWTYVNDWRWDWTEDPEESKTLALETARKAVELDPFDPESHHALGVVHLYNREFDKAIPLYEKAIALNPNDARRLVGTAPAWIYVGRTEEAVTQIERALRLNPHHSDDVLNYLGWAYYEEKEYEKALATLKRIEKSPWRSVLAVTYVRLGEMEKARAEVTALLKNDPDYSIERGKVYPYKDEGQWKHYYDALAEAGMPDHPPLELPDKPSIAVLPFTNMSNDPEQEYFVDGMTEDLITDLSKLSGLFVIARNSTFAYKGQSPDVRRVARELGVKYVLEGSVRRAGEQVRINAQLVEASTGGHLWAERYDGVLENVFELQDNVTQKIVTALAINLTTDAESNRTRIETKKPEAYDAFLQGWEHYRRGTSEDYRKAIPYFKQAVEIDPDYGRAWSALAAVYWYSISNGWWTESLDLPYIQARDQARKYLSRAMEEPTALAHQIAAEVAAHYRRSAKRSLAEAGHAIALDPNDPAGHLAMATALIKAGNPAAAMERVRTAMRLDPHYPASYLTRLGQAQFALGNYQDASATWERAASRNPHDDWNFVYLVSAYGHLGREADAKQALATANDLRFRQYQGALTMSTTREKIFKWPGNTNHLREGLRKAKLKSGAEWLSRLPPAGAPDRFDIEGTTPINAYTAKGLHERGVPFVVIAFFSERIPGSHYLEVWQETGEFNEVRLLKVVGNKSEEVVIYGGAEGLATANAVAMAASWGFEKIYHLRGGYYAWKEAGYPVETWLSAANKPTN